jgi:hypothetical protein
VSLWWCKVISQHGLMFLLLLATSQLWFRLSDSIIVVKELMNSKPCINVIKETTGQLFQLVKTYIEPYVRMAVNLTTRAFVATLRQVRAWLWSLMLRQTSLLLFMTFMHDEVWLPFILSMILVILLVGLVYLPNDTGNTYIPKRHRKWS